MGDNSSCALCNWLQVVDPVAAAQPAARSKDLMRAMKEAAQGMRGGREVRQGLAVRFCRSVWQPLRGQVVLKQCTTTRAGHVKDGAWGTWQ